MTVQDGQIVRRALISDPDPSGPAAAADAARSASADPAAVDVASHAAQFADLLAAVDTGRQPAVTGESGRAALEIVLAVYESSRTGRPVSLGR